MNIGLIERIKERLQRTGQSARAASLKAGLSDGFVQNILTGKSQHPRSDTIAKLAIALDTSEAWLQHGAQVPVVLGPNQGEVRRVELNVPAAGQMHKNLHVRGTAAGSIIHNDFEGFQVESDTIEFVRRPPALENSPDAYAFYIIGDSMFPMHSEGELRIANPSRPPQAGDTVVVQTRTWNNDPGQAYIKIYRRRAKGKIVLEQLNPQAIIEIPQEFVLSMHKVMSMAELFGL